MSNVFPVLGFRSTGKTFLILRLIERFNLLNPAKKSAGGKPIEVGISVKNAEDTLTDSEILNVAAGSSSPQLHNLYQGYQNLPIRFCAVTEGFKTNQEAFTKWLELVQEFYSPYFFEFSGGPLTPLFKGKNFADLASQFDSPLLYILDASVDGLEYGLPVLRTLKQSGWSGFIVLNNSTGSKDADWFQFIGKCAEDEGWPIAGIMPYLDPLTDTGKAAPAIDNILANLDLANSSS